MIAERRLAHPTRSALTMVLIVVLLAQVVLLLSIHALSVSLGQGGFYPIVLGGDDGKFHYAVAKYMVGTGEVGGSFELFDVTIWPTVIAAFMKLTGSDSILLIKQMLLFGRVLDIFAALLALEGLRKGNLIPDRPRAIFWSRVAVLLLVGFYPSGIIYSFGSLYRDSLIYGLYFMTVGLLVHCVTDKRNGPRLLFFALSIPVGYALYQFRAYAAYSILLAGFLWLLANLFRKIFQAAKRSSGPSSNRLVWVSMSLVIALGGSAAWYTRTVQEAILFRDSYFLMQGSNLRISFTGKNPIQAFPLYVYSFVSNAIGPLPWQLWSASTLLELALEVPLLVYVGYNVWKRRAALTPGCSFLIAQAIVWFAIISFTNDNIGTASRLRVIGWQCLFVVFAYLLPRVDQANILRNLKIKSVAPKAANRLPKWRSAL